MDRCEREVEDTTSNSSCECQEMEKAEGRGKVLGESSFVLIL